MTTRKPLTADQRYELGIKRLQAQITKLQRNRTGVKERAEISYLQTRLDTLEANRHKLQAAQAQRDAYNEHINTHNQVVYSAALIVAEKNIAHFESFAPTDADLYGVKA